MTAQEVRDEVVTIFMMAGHETTAQALTWTWYLLSLHPAVESKLHDELATALNGRAPQYEDLASLRYTRMVIEELMRLYPPAHTMAWSPIAADTILGHHIPAGAIVLIAPSAIAPQSIALGSAPSFSTQIDLRRSLRGSPTFRSERVSAFVSARHLQ